MNLSFSLKARIVCLLGSLFTCTLAVADIFQTAQHNALTAQHLSRRSVRAIKAIVDIADAQLSQALPDRNAELAQAANSNYLKAIKAARIEYYLKREERVLFRRYTRLLRSAGPTQKQESGIALRQVGAHLRSIADSRAFQRMKYGFIRRQLRAAKHNLKRIERAAPEKGETLAGRLNRIARLLDSYRKNLPSKERSDLITLRKIENLYSRAVAADASGRGDRARLLLDRAGGLLNRLRVTAGVSRRDGGRDESTCRRVVDACEKLRARVAAVVGASPVASELVARADRLITDSRRLINKHLFEESKEKVKLAERLYRRAYQIATKSETP